MSNKIEATFNGESNVEKAVRLRLVYDANKHAPLSGVSVTAWLDAENVLSTEEYHEYMSRYRAIVSETTKE